MNKNSKILNSSALALTGLLATSVMAPAAAFEPDTFEVTNCNNSGVGSLRQAIADAAGSEIAAINFDIECNLIELESIVTFSDQWLSINGPGADKLTIKNAASHNGVLIYGNGSNSQLSISNVTISQDEVEHNFYAGYIAVDGSIDLFKVEVTGISVNNFPAFNAPRKLSIMASAVYGNSVRNSYAALFAAGMHMDVDNSSFVGNTMSEGTLLHSTNSMAVSRSAFVDNVPELESDRDPLQLLNAQNSNLSLIANYFVEDHAEVSEDLYHTNATFNDLGGNLYAVNPAVTTIAGVTNTQTGNGASAIVTRADLKLGSFDRVLDPNEGLSAKVQQVLQGSVAIDAISFDATGTAFDDFLYNYQISPIPVFDAVGERRVPSSMIDAGPFEVDLPEVDEEPDPEEDSQQVKRSRNVFFNSMSAKLTKEAKKSIRKMVNNLPDGAENVKVKLVGFVQPADFSWNNISLSKARTKSVQKFMKKLGVEGSFKRYARGEDKDSTAKARRVQIIVKFDAPLS